MDDTRKAVERLLDLHGVGDNLPVELSGEAREITTQLLAQFMDAQLRIAAALENLVAIQYAACPITVQLPNG